MKIAGEFCDEGKSGKSVEDGIDSSKDAGKLMISVLSAMAEIKRENIIEQTMAGRREKAAKGKWNGGFAPYGYELVNGELFVKEEEAEAVKIIFDKYIHTNLGINGVTRYLEQHGIQKVTRREGELISFSSNFVKGVLDNPVYCGKIAYGRRTTEKVVGTRNDYHKEKTEDCILSNGIHEGIVTEEEWKIAAERRKKQEKSMKRLLILDDAIC